MTNPKLRRGRYSETDGHYAITAVTRDRRPFFLDSNLAAAVIAEIHFCEVGHLLENCAWVVMPDHLHWMFRLRTDDLSRCLQAFSHVPRAQSIKSAALMGRYGSTAFTITACETKKICKHRLAISLPTLFAEA